MNDIKRRKLEAIRDEILKKNTSGERTIEALDKVAASLTVLIDTLREKEMVVNVPEQVRVENFEDITPDVEVQNWPKEMAVKVANFPETPKVQKVEVTNQKEQKDNTPIFKKYIEAAAKTISGVFTSLWEKGISIKQNDKKTAIFVKQIDDKGNVVGQPNFQVFGSSGGGSGQIKNKVGQIINPATDEKLDDVIEALGSLEINADSVNLNTDELEGLLNDVKTIVSAISSDVDLIEQHTDAAASNLEGVIQADRISELNEIRVAQDNVFDELNSFSYHGIDPNERFSGELVDVSDYEEISISVFSEQDSARDGFSIIWTDQAGVDMETQSFTIRGGKAASFTPHPKFKYYRLEYRNGDLSSSLSILSILRKQATNGSFYKVGSNTSVSDEIGAPVNQSVQKLRVNEVNYIPHSGDEGGNAYVRINADSIGLSKEAKQNSQITLATTLNTLTTEISGITNWLKTLVKLFKPMSVVQGGGSNRLSVSVDAGTLAGVTTVSTVSTVSNQTNIGGINAFVLQQSALRNAFANGIRRNIV